MLVLCFIIIDHTSVSFGYHFDSSLLMLVLCLMLITLVLVLCLMLITLMLVLVIHVDDTDVNILFHFCWFFLPPFLSLTSSPQSWPPPPPFYTFYRFDLSINLLL